MSGGGGSGGGEDFFNNDHVLLLRSNSSASESDIDVQRVKRKGFMDLLKQLDRGFSGRRLSNSSIGNWSNKHLDSDSPAHDTLGDGAPPEWALLLIGCLLGLATGICVAAFNKGVSTYCYALLRRVNYFSLKSTITFFSILCLTLDKHVPKFS
ncbi:hypothetical protein ACHQM5_024913 [Ranunculus cassubicifolius]